MKRFITADWHLGETRFKVMHRPFTDQQEMIDHFVDKHNKIVDHNDLVYVNGDVCNRNTPQFLEQVSRFNGHKIVIRGNHDEIFSNEDLLKYFDEVIDEQGLELKIGDIDCNIVHYPSLAKKDKFNLVGHVHSAWKIQLNSFNVGVDCNHFMPHNLDETIPFIFNYIVKYCDNDIWASYNEANCVHRNRSLLGSYKDEK